MTDLDKRGAGEADVQGKTILIVDDEPHVTHVVSYKLEEQGADVITAVDGEEAYKLACEHRPDLIITDFQMPVLSGHELSVKLRTNPQTASIPVLMLTARGHKLSQEQLAQTNIRHLMAKPFSARELIARARELFHDPTSAGDDSGSGERGEEQAA